MLSQSIKLYSIVSLVSNIFGFLRVTSPTVAQIIPDQTLGNESSVVVPNQNIRGMNSDRIDGGAVRGGNLFHSFQEFNVDVGRGVYFSNPDSIVNILTRVSGENISNIWGTLGVLGNANLFLINPNGIVFGPNARLDVGGSFFASTADGILFENGVEFAASNPEAPPLLTINIPLGLNFRENPGTIQVQGTGHNLEIDSETNQPLRDNRPLGLEVPSGQTLGLIGGEVELVGGNLTAVGGRVELGSIAGTAQVTFSPSPQSWGDKEGQSQSWQPETTLSYNPTSAFGNIQLSQAASIEASNGGTIQLQGRNITLNESAVILANTQATQPGGNLTLRSSESIQLVGSLEDNPFSSSILANVEPEAIFKGSDVTIETGVLQILDGATLSASTFGVGQGGNVEINANVVEVNNANLFVETSATGDGGNLTVDTGRLLVLDGGFISANASPDSTGNGGRITINATESVELRGQLSDGFFASDIQAGTRGSGNAGGVEIQTTNLVLQDGGGITTGTNGRGNGGDLTVRASESVELSGTFREGTSSGGLFAQSNPEATGNAGTLTVETQRLTVRDGAQISVSTQSPGNGGTMLINASESVEILDGVFREDGSRVTSGLFSSVGRLNDPDINPQATGKGGDIILETQRLLVRNSQLTASTFAIGDGGTLTLNVGELVIQDGGQVGVGSFGEGEGGELNVNATESITIFGTGLDFTLPGETELRPVNSRLFAQSESSGNAGNIQVTTGDLIVRERGEVTTRSLGSANAGTINLTARSLSITNTGQISSSSEGQGAAGNLNITIRDDIRLDRASITANTVAGEGNIRLRSQDFRLRNNSNVTTNATGVAPGGNIEIDTRQLVALENSDISANAEQAQGGRVTINTDTIFGIQFRQQPSDASDITATSQLGAEFSGTVQLNSEVDTSQGLVELFRDVVDPAALIAQNPCQQGENSEFTMTGRGGLPPNPTQGTRQRGVSVGLTDLVESEQTRQNLSRQASETHRHTATPLDQPLISSRDLVPARGWIRDENGDVILVSYDPTKTGVQRQPQQYPNQCHSDE